VFLISFFGIKFEIPLQTKRKRCKNVWVAYLRKAVEPKVLQIVLTQGRLAEFSEAAQHLPGGE